MSLPGAMSERAVAVVQPLDLAIAHACERVSHNLNGQRLGRKGRETRERIIRTAIDELEGESDEPFTLSAVARRAGLGMSSLYNYFTDLSELMVAVLEPVMESARVTYLSLVDDYWPDDAVAAKSEEFWNCYWDFWNAHAAILHQRNRMSDAGDDRMLRDRVQSGHPLMQGICRQLGTGDMDAVPLASEEAMASVLVTMMERTITVQSKPSYRKFIRQSEAGRGPDLVPAGSHLLALAVLDSRKTHRQKSVQPRLKGV